ncbi:MAG: radical SAM protein [Promethearchaeota archaeon]
MTFRCPITCSHCFLEAGPSREEEISLKNAIDWIEQAVFYNDGFIKGLSLTGGDPFYIENKFKAIVKFAEEVGLQTTATTSAFWAITKEKAIEILKDLPLSIIAISTDVFHQEYIPFSYIKNAIHAAEYLNIDYEIVLTTENIGSPEYNSIINKLSEITDKSKIEVTTVFPVGRAKHLQMNKNFVKEPPKIPCLFATSPFIFPDGLVTACIGPLVTLYQENPLILGHLKDQSLEEILNSSENHLVLQALRLWGPSFIYHALKKNGNKSILPRHFIENSICDACYSLLKNEAIRKRLGGLEDFKEKIAYERALYMNEVGMLEKLLGKKIKLVDQLRKKIT